ncbi:MAG: hypothetical protein ACR2OH_01205 [Microthrixaceae bacterium]
MIVAEMEAFYSRPVAPTRRVAVGELLLPDDGAEDAAAMLLGGVIAAFGRRLDEDDIAELTRLVTDVALGRRIPQPRLRHRFQADRIGLKRSATMLVEDADGFYELVLDHTNGTSAQHALAAVYSMAQLGHANRKPVATAMRRGLEWVGEVGPELLGTLRPGASGRHLGPAASASDPVSWALGVLGLSALDGRPPRTEVRQAFRDALRSAHPDHGASERFAATRIAELDTARRILLG